MVNDVLFKYGLQAAYDALKTAGTIDEKTLYWTTDTHKLYKGSTLYTGRVVAVETLPETPEVGLLYVVTTTGAASTWTGTEWVTLTASDDGTAHDVTYVAETRTITIPMTGRDDLVINLGKDLVVESGVYDDENKSIVLTLNNDETVTIPVADLVDIYTGGATQSVTVAVSESNEITATVKVSAETGNALTVKEDGLYLSVAAKADKIVDAVGGKVAVTTADGNVAESAAVIGGATLAETANANTLATEAAVKAAVDAAQETADTAVETKIAKMADAAGNKVVVSTADGEVAESTMVLGGATLAETPADTTLATEAAVAAAISASATENAVVWSTF